MLSWIFLRQWLIEGEENLTQVQLFFGRSLQSFSFLTLSVILTLVPSILSLSFSLLGQVLRRWWMLIMMNVWSRSYIKQTALGKTLWHFEGHFLTTRACRFWSGLKTLKCRLPNRIAIATETCRGEYFCCFPVHLPHDGVDFSNYERIKEECQVAFKSLSFYDWSPSSGFVKCIVSSVIFLKIAPSSKTLKFNILNWEEWYSRTCAKTVLKIEKGFGKVFQGEMTFKPWDK